jgi:hypothetical protein
MPRRASHVPKGDADDTLRFCGADLRDMRLIAARDFLAERDPHRLIRLLDAIYARGFRDGWARGLRRAAAPRDGGAA